MRRLLPLSLASLLLAASPAIASQGASDAPALPQVTVEVEAAEVEEGLEFGSVTVTLPDGGVARGLMYRWSQEGGRFALRPQLALGDLPGVAGWQEATADVDWDGTVAVFNGGYWLPDGAPNGPWAHEGQAAGLLGRDGSGAPMLLSRGAAAVTAAGDLLLGRWRVEATLQGAFGSFDVSLEQEPPGGGLALLTGEPPQPPLHFHTLGSLVFGTSPLQPSGPAPLRPVPAHLVSVDGSLLQQVLSDPEATITLTLGEGLPEVRHLLPGAPLLLQDGLPTPAADGSAEGANEAEHLSAAHRNGRHPRTAIASGSNRLMLLVLDGRQPGWSDGVTLAELAAVLLQLGAEDALNLDGGGSTRATGPDGDLNRPSETGRQVANTLRLERRQLTVDPLTGASVHWGSPGDTVVWCSLPEGRAPFAYRDGVWSGPGGLFPSHVELHEQHPGALPVCALTDSGLLLALWADGVYHTPSGPLPLAWPGWQPEVTDVDGDGYEELGARRGRMFRWADREGAIRTVVDGQQEPVA